MITPELWKRITEPLVYVCTECGSTDVQGTAWIVLNNDEPTNDEPPDADNWCPVCEDNEAQLCLVNLATGRCEWHGEEGWELQGSFATVRDAALLIGGGSLR